MGGQDNKKNQKRLSTQKIKAIDRKIQTVAEKLSLWRLMKKLR